MPITLNHEALAWAAGFFDGEGSVHVAYRYKRKDGTSRPYPQVSVGQSGESGSELLAKFQNAVGLVGKMYGPLPVAKNQRKVRYIWEASGFMKTQAIMAMLWPWLGTVKREKFATVCATVLADGQE